MNTEKKTWYIGTILNMRTGEAYAIVSEHSERIDELASEVELREDEILFKNDTADSGQ